MPARKFSADRHLAFFLLITLGSMVLLTDFLSRPHLPVRCEAKMELRAPVYAKQDFVDLSAWMKPAPLADIAIQDQKGKQIITVTKEAQAWLLKNRKCIDVTSNNASALVRAQEKQ